MSRARVCDVCVHGVHTRVCGLQLVGKNARGAGIEANSCSRDNVIFTFDSRTQQPEPVDRVARIAVLSNYTSTRHISRLLPVGMDAAESGVPLCGFLREGLNGCF